MKDKFDELNLEYSQAIANKKGGATAQVFNDYKHRFQQLSLETTLEIAQNLSFMNKTLALMKQMQSFAFKQQMGYFEDVIPTKELMNDKTHQDKLKQAKEKIENTYRAKLNAYGFPTNNLKETSSNAKNKDDDVPSSDNIQSVNPY
ncbi:hypothetical protein HCD_05200 [Helicobacter cetorum MIT 99-5656]|uniref:Uncharacterized protein n=1 Tax=Helicobacter cetorum (strain ATCC BAA-540 / CCUG 52418 / MIT 99-5656) TaxID=1163745 RepID=I0ESX3_HELCM|nr:hypothetical protein HCD_05200 [Helicobacter cetorum MIT 99-5656]